MAGVTVRVQSRRFRRAVADMQDRSRRLRPAYNEIGEQLKRSVAKTFKEGGRPKRWKPLASSTIIGRLGGRSKVYKRRGGLRAKAKRKAFGQKPLIQSGRLLRSITYRATGSYVDLGTNVVYAATHHYGRGKIPARPFLVVQPEDLVAARKTIAEYVLGDLLG